MANWILQIAALAVLFSLIYELIPEGEMKRISGMVLAIVFALRILSPVVSASKEQLSAWFLTWNTDIEISQGDDTALIEEILLDYENRCTEELTAYLKKQEGVLDARVEVIINQDRESDTFGSLEHVYVYVSFSQEEEEDRLDSWIEPIEILPGIFEDSRQEGNHEEQCKVLKQTLSEWLQLEESCITVFEEE